MVLFIIIPNFIINTVPDRKYVGYRRDLEILKIDIVQSPKKSVNDIISELVRIDLVKQ